MQHQSKALRQAHPTSVNIYLIVTHLKNGERTRSSGCYKHKVKADDELVEELNKLAQKHAAIGFWQSYHRIRLKGFAWNHKRVYRVYTKLHLNIRRRSKRLPGRVKQALCQPKLSTTYGQ